MGIDSADGRDEQLVALIAQHQATLRAVVRSLAPGSSDCEDILQETNLVLWRKRETYEPGTNFGAWAATIARYQVLAWRKRQQRDRVLGFDEDLLERIGAAAAERFGDMADRRVALQSCLAALSAENRKLIEHRYFAKAALSEYAESQGKTYAAVAKTLQRVREMLRDCINQRLAHERSQ